VNHTITSVVNHRRFHADRTGAMRRPAGGSRLDAEQTPIFYALTCSRWADRQRQAARRTAAAPPTARAADHGGPGSAVGRYPVPAQVTASARLGGAHGLPPSSSGRHRRPYLGPRRTDLRRTAVGGRAVGLPRQDPGDAPTGRLPAVPGDREWRPGAVGRWAGRYGRTAAQPPVARRQAAFSGFSTGFGLPAGPGGAGFPLPAGPGGSVG
jgi:hypothetical protein